jgi:mannitol-1-phosphate/altronate dehydrogenase
MKYVTLRGRQIDIAEMLERNTSFPAMILDRILTYTTKPHDEVIEFLCEELIRRASQRIYYPPFAGWALACQIAQQFHWVQPQKRGPVRGMSTEEIEEMRQMEPEQYRRWLATVNAILKPKPDPAP